MDCDLTSDESVRASVEEARGLGHTRIASILHLTAYYSFSGEPSPLYQEVTVRGTEQLLHGLRAFEVEQLILRERGEVPVVFLRVWGVYDDGCHSIPTAHQIKRIYERGFAARN